MNKKTETASSPSRWRSWLGVAFVALTAIGCQWLDRTSSAPPWTGFLLAALLGIAVLCCAWTVMRGFWSLIAAIVVVAHPLLRAERAGEAALQGELIKYAVLLCVLAMARTAIAPRWRPLTLLALAIVACVLGGLAQLTTADACAMVMSLGVFGLLFLTGAMLLARGDDHVAKRPSKWNVLIIGLLLLSLSPGMICAAYGLTLAKQKLPDGVAAVVVCRSAPDTTELREFARESLPTVAPQDRLPGFGIDQLPHWAWPYHWGVLVLAGLGFMRTLMRGLTQCAKPEPATGWVLFAFAAAQIVVAWLMPQSQRDLFFAPWATLSILLAVFGVGDTIRAFSERMILTPPEDVQLNESEADPLPSTRQPPFTEANHDEEPQA